jgi:hypothetical protein
MERVVLKTGGVVGNLLRSNSTSTSSVPAPSMQCPWTSGQEAQLSGITNREQGN